MPPADSARAQAVDALETRAVVASYGGIRGALRHAARARGLRFSLQELSGSLGDLGTFLPLVLGLCATCDFDLGAVLIAAGLLNVVTGLIFRQPLPVQPMKAIAAVAIAGGLSRAEVTAGGLIVAVIVLTLAISGGVSWAARHIPKTVVRGIQLSIGVKLVQTALGWLTGVKISGAGLIYGRGLPWLGGDSLLTAALCAAALLGAAVLSGRGGAPAAGPSAARAASAAGSRAAYWFRRLSLPLSGAPLLLIFFLAGALIVLTGPAAGRGIHLVGPRLAWLLPTDGHVWWTALWSLAAAQVPLTLLNSVLAVCALSADCFPGHGVPPRRMALSVALMNLVTIPLGGIPVCHGAGGLAAQYRFGARSGGSVIMLGGLKVAAGLLFGASLAGFLTSYPRSILALMLIFAAASLAAPARDCRRPAQLAVMLATALAILLTNAIIGVGFGLCLAGALHIAGVSSAAAAGAQNGPVVGTCGGEHVHRTGPARGSEYRSR